MNQRRTYKIPEEYFFRLHHVRPRFKNNVEEVLLYVATSISELRVSPQKGFNEELNKVLYKFNNNAKSTKKTIDNWRTEISALFGFVVKNDSHSRPGKTAIRLSNNQYLDEFFNYFLYSFQYPGGHVKPKSLIKQIEAGIRFKPCQFIINLLIEGEKLSGKPFMVTAEELTQCAYFDLRVTTGNRTPVDVARTIIDNRRKKISYDYSYQSLRNERTGRLPSVGDINRYAGDILDYMVLANILNHKGTGYYYYLNTENIGAINYHLNNNVWFNGYDKYYGLDNIPNREIIELEYHWLLYVNRFDGIAEFVPRLKEQEVNKISSLIEEYYYQLKGVKNQPTKIIGDYGETLILAHEYLRTKNKSNRQHLINKIPTPLGVGYDLQSIEIQKNKRYIEVKTTKSKKSININRFKLTPNEFDTAETLGDRYFIYYLVINEKEKNIFMIQNPVEQCRLGNLKIDNNLIVEFNKKAGKWHKLMEIVN